MGLQDPHVPQPSGRAGASSAGGVGVCRQDHTQRDTCSVSVCVLTGTGGREDFLLQQAAPGPQTWARPWGQSCEWDTVLIVLGLRGQRGHPASRIWRQPRGDSDWRWGRQPAGGEEWRELSRGRWQRDGGVGGNRDNEGPSDTSSSSTPRRPRPRSPRSVT